VACPSADFASASTCSASIADFVAANAWRFCWGSSVFPRTLRVRPGRFLFPTRGGMHHDPAPATLHRRPAPAQLLSQNHRDLRGQNRRLRQAFRPIARTARRRGDSRVPTAHARTPAVVEQFQPGGLRAPLSLLHHARPANTCRSFPRANGPRRCPACSAPPKCNACWTPPGPAQVLKYLARYTHRVAISNARLLDISDGQVKFRYKDYADAHKQKTMTLDADEFLRRFVQHVLPKSFVKIRQDSSLRSIGQCPACHPPRAVSLSAAGHGGDGPAAERTGRRPGTRPAALLSELWRHPPGVSRSRRRRGCADQIPGRQFIVEGRKVVAARCGSCAGEAVASAVRTMYTPGHSRRLIPGVIWPKQACGRVRFVRKILANPYPIPVDSTAGRPRPVQSP
jgi:hypothetical protein